MTYLAAIWTWLCAAQNRATLAGYIAAGYLAALGGGMVSPQWLTIAVGVVLAVLKFQGASQQAKDDKAKDKVIAGFRAENDNLAAGIKGLSADMQAHGLDN
jgi:uncharacterized membrane protein